MYLQRLFRILLLTLCWLNINEATSLLAQVDLASTNYSTIHAFAVQDQINRYEPAQKSLQTRHPVSLNGLFDFCLDPEGQGFRARWYSSSLKSSCQVENFYLMPVPSAYNDITSNASVQNYVGWVWYQLLVNWVPETRVNGTDDESWNWFLQFDSVNYLALVWIQSLGPTYNQNVSFLGSHVGGHLPFKLSVAPHLLAGPFRLTVAVSNRLTEETIPSGSMINLTQVVGHNYYKFQPDFDFFHYSGIMGDIQLFQLAPVHIAHVLRLNASSPDQIHLKVCLNEPSNRTFDRFHLAGTLTTLESELIQFTSVDLLLDQQRCTNLSFTELNSTLIGWRLSSGNPNAFPNILLATLELHSGGVDKLMDRYELKVGLWDRKRLDFDATRGLLVDGQRRQLQGFGMHQEQLFSGRFMSRAAIMKDMYLLKRTGANVLRTSHYPYSEAYLDACDLNGLLVICEGPAVGLKSFSTSKLALHKQLMLEMMELHHHHPSVVMWSVANEPQSQWERAKPYFESLLSYCRQELAHFTRQAGRPLAAAIAQSHQADRIGHTLDAIMVNHYFGWYDYPGVLETIKPSIRASLAGWSARHPGKALLVSEFGADTLAGEHSNEAHIFSEEYQRDLLEEHESLFNELFNANQTTTTTKINFIGSMVWNFADFATHPSLLRPGGNRKGVFARDRQPKASQRQLAAAYAARNEL